tara:strand:- start:854 stop:1792 length:939 start_codon:yes stop_codon:yes gene_type:complete
MKTNLFCITSHCDNNDKLELLKNNINILKTNGFQVLVSSHIPLDEEILKSIDYFIYDKSNPILYYPERALKFWKTVWVSGRFWELKTYLPDYGWTVLNQFKKISAFCKTLDYSKFTIINYDVKIKPGMLGEFDGNVLSTVKWRDGKTRFPSLIFFSLVRDDFFEFTDRINRKKYAKTKRDTETYAGTLLFDLNAKMEVYEDDVEDFVDFKIIKDDSIWSSNTINDHFQLFNDNDRIIIYDLKHKVKFNIDDQIIEIEAATVIDNKLDKIGFYVDEELIDIKHFLEDRNNIMNILTETKTGFDIKTQKHTTYE